MSWNLLWDFAGERQSAPGSLPETNGSSDIRVMGAKDLNLAPGQSLKGLGV